MELIKPTVENLKPMINTLCDSFLFTELYEKLLPDQKQREIFLKKFFAFRAKYGLAYGDVYCSSDFKSVAMWIPPRQSMNFYHIIRFGGASAMIKAGRAVTKKLIDFEKIMSKSESDIAPMPHWHLSPIAVASMEQGKGYGKELLTYKLKELDNIGQTCYLETQSSNNVELYRHFGFKLKETTCLESVNLNNYAMLREPM